MKRNEERINVLVGTCKEHHSYIISKALAQKSKETNSLPLQHVSTEHFASMRSLLV